MEEDIVLDCIQSCLRSDGCSSPRPGDVISDSRGSITITSVEGTVVYYSVQLQEGKEHNMFSDLSEWKRLACATIEGGAIFIPVGSDIV